MQSVAQMDYLLKKMPRTVLIAGTFFQRMCGLKHNFHTSGIFSASIMGIVKDEAFW